MNLKNNQIFDRISPIFEKIKIRIFGVNNENLDLVIDTFYKLTPPQRNGVLAGITGFISLFVFLAIFLYFVQVHALQEELDTSLQGLANIRALKVEDQKQSEKFDSLAEMITRKNKGFNFKPFFEKLSKTLNVELSGLSEKEVALDADNPLSKKAKIVNVEMKLPKISLPKLLNFLIEIEKSNHLMKIHDIKITGQYGNKLYFDIQMLIRSYAAAQ